MSSNSSSCLYLVLESGMERKIAASNTVLRLVQGMWAYYEEGVPGARYILYLRRPMKHVSMGNFLNVTCNFTIDSFCKLDEIETELEAHRYWSIYHKNGREKASLAQDSRAAELLSEAATEPTELVQLRDENSALKGQLEQLTRLNCEVSQSAHALQASKARVQQLQSVLAEMDSRLVGIKTQSARDLVAAQDLLEAERTRRCLACECAASTLNAVGCKFGAAPSAESMALALDYFALQRGADAPRALSLGCEQLRRVIPPNGMLCYAATCRFLLRIDENAASYLHMLICTAQPVGTEMA
eukprot:1008457-Rhodomonas_salina.4